MLVMPYVKDDFKKYTTKEEELHLMEYVAINLPETLRSGTNLIEVLSKIDKKEYFDSFIFESIINFKWQKYTFSFYRN